MPGLFSRKFSTWERAEAEANWPVAQVQGAGLMRRAALTSQVEGPVHPR